MDLLKTPNRGAPATVGGPSSAEAYAWYVLVMLVACYGVYNLDKSVISVVLEPIRTEFRMTDTQLGLLTGLATTLPFALTCIPVGLLADRVRRQGLLVVLIVVWSLMTGVAGLAQGMLLLFVARMGVGAAEAGFTPISLSMLTDYFPRRFRATALGAFGLGAPLGILFGLGVGGYVVAAWGWRAAFFIAGAPGLLLAGVLALTVREPVRVSDTDLVAIEVAPSFLSVLRQIIADRALLHIIFGMLLCLAPIAALAIWLPSFLARSYALTMRSAGPMSALIFGVFGSFGATICSIAADRVGAQREARKLLVPIYGTIIGILCGLLGVLAAPSPGWALATLGPCAFFAQSITGAGYGMVATLSPTQMRTSILAVVLVAINLLSYGLGAQLVGLVSDQFAALNPTRSLAYGLATTFVFSAWGLLHLRQSMRLLQAPGR